MHRHNQNADRRTCATSVRAPRSDNAKSNGRTTTGRPARFLRGTRQSAVARAADTPPPHLSPGDLYKCLSIRRYPTEVTRRGVSPNPGHQKRVRNDFSIFLSDSNAAPAPVATHKRHKGPRLGAGLGAGRGASRRPGPAIEDGPEFLEPLGCAQDDGGSSSPSKLGMLATRRQMQGSLKSSPRSSSRRSGDARSLAKGRSR